MPPSISEQPIDAILFDLGGVLVQLGGMPAVRRWFGQDLSEAEIWDLWLDSPAVRAYERGHCSRDDFAGAVVEEFGWALGPQAFIEDFSAFVVGLYPRVPQLLKAVRPGVTMACLSNTNELHWERMSVDFGLGEYLHHSYASHLIGEVKPDRGAYLKAIEGLDIDPSRILYLDDLARNVEAGRQAGLTAEIVQGEEDLERVLSQFGLLQ